LTGKRGYAMEIVNKSLPEIPARPFGDFPKAGLNPYGRDDIFTHRLKGTRDKRYYKRY
jgi:hypothetical protein